MVRGDTHQNYWIGTLLLLQEHTTPHQVCHTALVAETRNAGITR